MKKYIAKDGDRLDNVIYRHYKTLNVFEYVLSFNSTLSAILKAGDIVYLPYIELKRKEEVLW